MNSQDKPIPSFLTDGAFTGTTQDVGTVPKPELGVYPTEAQVTAYPRESAIVISGLYTQKSQELSDSITREADLRDALCFAVAAMESAVSLSVLMARGHKNAANRPPSHMQIQNVLDLSLFHIKETTGITPEGEA